MYASSKIPVIKHNTFNRLKVLNLSEVVDKDLETCSPMKVNSPSFISICFKFVIKTFQRMNIVDYIRAEFL